MRYVHCHGCGIRVVAGDTYHLRAAELAGWLNGRCPDCREGPPQPRRPTPTGAPWVRSAIEESMTTIDHVPTLNGTAMEVSAYVHSPIERIDADRLYSEAVWLYHGGARKVLDDDQVDDLIDVVEPVQAQIDKLAFAVAMHRLDLKEGERYDQARTRVVALIMRMGKCRRSAYYMCEAVQLAKALPVKKLGEPSIRHLRAIVRSKLKQRYTLNEDGVEVNGWDTVPGWMLKKGWTFESVSPAALAKYCDRQHDEIMKEAKKRKKLPLPEGDPHEPADVEVVDEAAATPARPLLPHAAAPAPVSAASRLADHLDKYTAWVDHLTVPIPEAAAADDLDAVLRGAAYRGAQGAGGRGGAE